MSDFNAGDLIAVPFKRGVVRGLVQSDGSAFSECGREWSAETVRSFEDVRRLVVIDAEDREQVERLLAGYYTERGEWVAPRSVDKMQAALHEFANPEPAKPDEPTGLGAVVRDGKGVLWVRWRRGDERRPWREDDRPSTYEDYVDIDAIEVLSEGVES